MQTLGTQIASGEIAPGETPGSREAMAAECVSSVSVIDQALVAPDAPPGAHSFSLYPNETLKDVVAILEMRPGLETVAAAIAAERRDDAQMTRIADAAKAFEASADQARPIVSVGAQFVPSLTKRPANRLIPRGNLLNSRTLRWNRWISAMFGT